VIVCGSGHLAVATCVRSLGMPNFPVKCETANAFMAPAAVNTGPGPAIEGPAEILGSVAHALRVDAKATAYH
jgi:hypothetical protein